MTHEEYEEAARYWVKKDAEAQKAEPGQLRTYIEDFLAANKTCVLGTGSGNTVRCTPVDYAYHDGAIWVFTEGGRKFSSLEHNANVSVAVFQAGGSMGNLHSLQIQGKAEVVTPWSAEYERAAGQRHIPLDALKKLARPMNLLKIVPEEADYLDSGLKKQGLSSRQHLDF
ncbi:MAG: pyridoxamine 5'-phosphate oxidase family protein [Treponema sp.]|nr:pyridoxamine 5'-phosphate oxidase family protein [Treponema sp.]